MIDGSGSYVAIVSCVACGHWWTLEPPKQATLDRWYKEGSPKVLGDGWEGEVESSMSSGDAVAPSWIAREEAVLGPDGRGVVELGPGDFGLIKWFELHGYNWRAVEVGSWAQDQERVVESIGLLPAGDGSAIAVALDVLEHVADPISMLRELVSKLDASAPERRVYLSFPNAESWRARGARARWRMVRPYGHLHYFSRGSTMGLLSRCGLSPIRIETYDLNPRDGRTLERLKYRFRSGKWREGFGLLRDAAISTAAESFERGDQWHVVAEPQHEAT